MQAFPSFTVYIKIRKMPMTWKCYFAVYAYAKMHSKINIAY